MIHYILKRSSLSLIKTSLISLILSKYGLINYHLYLYLFIYFI